MRKLSTLAFALAFASPTAALSQDTIVTVDLWSIGPELASELHLDLDDLPESVELSADLAAEVCGVGLASLGENCVAIISTAELIAAIEDSEGDGAAANGNSARQFAPGQQDGAAKDFAPGQQEGDARDHAPGQVKKDSGSDDTTD